ncbi:hypothetical protein PV326_012481 [Microctonus aethiopoides]|nr:hypothetical protein PV326_012481 [Microctonus aethiopoides]
MTFGGFLIIFIYCQCADDVLNESKNLGTSIYMTDWLYLSVNSQKSLIIIMARTLKPFEYKLNHTVLSLDLFTAIVKVSFSTFNLLQQTSG